MSKAAADHYYQTIWAEAKAAHAILRTLHPTLFDLEKAVPFKIGLRDEVIERYPDIEPAVAAAMFRWLSSRKAYMAACTTGTERHGLDGPSGIVSETDAAFAKAKLERRLMLDEIKSANRRPKEIAA